MVKKLEGRRAGAGERGSGKRGAESGERRVGSGREGSAERGSGRTYTESEEVDDIFVGRKCGREDLVFAALDAASKKRIRVLLFLD